jgi:hypothetical protein
MTTTTIDEAIVAMTGIVNWARRENSRLGYFAAMYRNVTVRVKEGIEQGEFEDGERMEWLDCVFANRYLDAVDTHRSGGVPTQSWWVPFEAADTWRLLVIQHLFAGMNAHINLDLGIAAAQVAPGDSIHGLENDFRRINTILQELTDDVHADLASIWPLLHGFDVLLGRLGDRAAGVGMTVARDVAWKAALRLAAAESDEALTDEIARLDARVAQLGREILSPGYLGNSLTTVVRLGEWKTVRQTIDTLAEPPRRRGG